MAETEKKRLAGLDLFRGLTVALMIIVNTPGSGEHVWWPLDHAAWHGFTPTDLVFPAFLCAMGVALGLSFPRRIDGKVWTRIVRRTLLLILIGWAWQMLARPGIENFRIWGVLPRLGLCYGLAATLAVVSARRDDEGRSHLNAVLLSGIALLILAGYWAALALGGDYTPAGNLAGYVDRVTIGTQHMWRFGTDAAGNVVYDPEGLLSTLPALANVLLGILAAMLWKRDPERATRRLAVAGMVLAVLGLALSPVLPLNKRIWTSSYALLSSGLSALVFILCILAARTPVLRKALWPLDVLGMNAILGYIVSLLIGLAGMRWGFQAAVFSAIDGGMHAPYLSSFLYALAVLLLVTALLIPLHRRGIHLRL